MLNGGKLANTLFPKYVLSIGIGTMLSGMIYFMDYQKICKHSLLIYMVGVVLNIFCFISDDLDIEILYAILPFYGIAFAGFINQINHKKRNVVKTIVLSIISIALLRKGYTVMGIFIAMIYLIIITVKVLNLKRNKIKYIAMLWVIPILILGSNTYHIISGMNVESGTKNAKNELINSAELVGTVQDPRRNWNDMTAYDFINSDYEFLSFLAQYGWVTSIGMSLACILLSVKLIINVINIKDQYGKLIITTIASIYILQTVSNFRMSLTIAGVAADAPIPLVSFGTTGLVVNMMCMALVLSVYRRKNADFETKEGGAAIEF